MAPLFRARPAMLFVTLLATSVFSVISLWPASTDATNPCVLLVYSILAGSRLPPLRRLCLFASNPSQRVGENGFVIIWDFNCCLQHMEAN